MLKINGAWSDRVKGKPIEQLKYECGKIKKTGLVILGPFERAGKSST